MLDKEFIENWRDAKKRSAERLSKVEPKNKMTYAFIAEAYLHHGVSCYLLKEDFKESLVSAVENYFLHFKLGNGVDDYPLRIEMLHPMILTGEVEKEILESFSSYKKEKKSFQPFFFHTFVLANYLLDRVDIIKEHEDEIISAEKAKGGNHLIYSNWTKTILALSERNETSFKEYLGTILDEHKLMQRRSLKKSVLGEIALPALSLLKLAKQAGMAIEIDNPLAPKDLIDF